MRATFRSPLLLLVLEGLGSPAHTGEGALSACPGSDALCVQPVMVRVQSQISQHPGAQAATASEGLFPRSCDLPQRATQGACSFRKWVG